MLKTAYIFDIDMTISDDTHRRHLMPNFQQNMESPFTAWNAYSLACIHDKPIEPVKSILLTLADRHDIVLASSREVIAEQLTWDWLVKHGFPVERKNIYLRPVGEHRSPHLVKKDMFKNIMQKFKVKGVFDDNERNLLVAKRLGVRGYFVGSPKHMKSLQQRFRTR